MGKAGDLLAKHFNTLEVKLTKAQEFTLDYLLRREDLGVKECHLFKLLLCWGQNRAGGNDLKGVLKNLTPLVRFACMTPYEFTTFVLPTGLLSAEETVQIYSVFGCDPAARSEIGKNKRLSLAPRKAVMMEKSVGFLVSPTKATCHNGHVPLKECISFQAKIGPNTSPKVWCEFSMKRPSIKGICIRWPGRKVENSKVEDNTLNFKVGLKWCGGVIQDNNVEEKFSIVLAQRTAGKEEMVIVEPPIELINGIKYCITVEDLSTHCMTTPTLNPSTMKHDTVKYIYYGTSDYSWIKQTPIINLEKWPVQLGDIDRNKNLTGFGNYPRFQVV